MGEGRGVVGWQTVGHCQRDGTCTKQPLWFIPGDGEISLWFILGDGKIFLWFILGDGEISL